MMDGGTWVDDMSFSSDGNGKIYFMSMAWNPPLRYYRTMKWNVSTVKKNTIELHASFYDKDNENKLTESHSKLETLYYKDGHVVMKGMQPKYYSSPYKFDYILIEGYIRFDQETLDEYAAYEPYENIEFIN